MALSKFGQYVHLSVSDIHGTVVFKTDSLKVDFDVREISGWTRAAVTVTNLNNATIKMLSDGQMELFVTIKTQLHDGPLNTLLDRAYVSNALEEIILPDSMFRMFCYSKIKYEVLDKQVDVNVRAPSIRNIIKEILQAANFNGNIEYKHFPDELLNYIPPKNFSRQQGSVSSLLESNGNIYGFNSYTVGNDIVIAYKPDSSNVSSTDMYKVTDIKLATTNMRANPKIGPAIFSVKSNLDPRIRPSSVLDITELLTLGTSTDQATLEVAENFLKEKVAGFSKYQALSIQHKGSNWSDLWLTQIVAVSPTPGTSMPTQNWWT